MDWKAQRRQEDEGQMKFYTFSQDFVGVEPARGGWGLGPDEAGFQAPQGSPSGSASKPGSGPAPRIPSSTLSSPWFVNSGNPPALIKHW